MQGVVVLKVGGSIGTADLSAPLAAIHWLLAAGKHPVVVHGGGPRITAALAEAGVSLPFVAGQRMTTEEAMPIVARVLSEEVNRDLVDGLQLNGIVAQPFTHLDCVLRAEPIPGMGRTATVHSVAHHPLEHALRDGYIPVLAPVPVDHAGVTYNANADIAAGAVAAALGAERIIFFTDVDGIYSDFAAKVKLTWTSDTQLLEALGDGKFEGGMLPKVKAVLSAIDAGTDAAFIVHGQKSHAAVWAVSQPIAQGNGSLNETAPGTCVRKSVAAVGAEIGGD